MYDEKIGKRRGEKEGRMDGAEKGAEEDPLRKEQNVIPFFTRPRNGTRGALVSQRELGKSHLVKVSLELTISISSL